ncbi:MAG: hypothetical protein ACPGU7_00325 [Gammaproteobacteria bacterium]
MSQTTPHVGTSTSREATNDSSFRRRVVGLSILALSGVFLLAGFEAKSASAMGLGFLACGLVGLMGFIHTLRQWRTRFSLSGVHADMILMWFGVGTFVSLTWGDPITLGVVLHRDFEGLAMAALLLVASALALRMVAFAEARFWVPVMERIGTLKLFMPPPMFVFLVVVVVLVSFAVYSGEISFRRIGTQGGQRISAFWSLVQVLGYGLAGYLGWALGAASGRLRVLLITLFLAYLPTISLLVLGEGRRLMLVVTLIFVAAYLVGRGQAVSLRWIAWRALIGFIVLVFGFMVFNEQRNMRMSRVQMELDVTTLVQSVPRASREVLDDLATAFEDQIENVTERLFIIGYPQELLMADNPVFGFGRGMAAEVLVAIPSALLPDKDELVEKLGGYGEMRNPDFGLPYPSDYANSVVTTAYMDFGWAAPLIVAASVFAIGSLSALLIRLISDPFFTFTALTLMLVVHLQVENSYALITLGTLRTLIILAPISMLLHLWVSPARRAAREAYV